MNSFLANNTTLWIDAIVAEKGYIFSHELSDFMTLYGLVYPLDGGHGILRMLLDAPTPQSLLDLKFTKLYMTEAKSRFVYLDWNARLWLCNIAAGSMMIGRVPQKTKPVFYGRDSTTATFAAVNEMIPDGASYLQAGVIVENLTVDRIGSPIAIDLEHFKSLKPQDGVNLPTMLLPKVIFAPKAPAKV